MFITVFRLYMCGCLPQPAAAVARYMNVIRLAAANGGGNNAGEYTQDSARVSEEDGAV